MIKKLPVYIILFIIFSCAKDTSTGDSSVYVSPPSNTINTGSSSTTVTQYTLTVNAGEGGTVSGGGEYEEGSEATITAIPNGCYIFTSWSDGNINPIRTLNINADQNITANFEFSK